MLKLSVTEPFCVLLFHIGPEINVYIPSAPLRGWRLALGKRSTTALGFIWGETEGIASMHC